MASFKGACFLMFVLFVGVSKTENVETSEDFNVRAEKSDSSLMNVSPKLQSERIKTTRPSSTSQVMDNASMDQVVKIRPKRETRGSRLCWNFFCGRPCTIFNRRVRRFCFRCHIHHCGGMNVMM